MTRAQPVCLFACAFALLASGCANTIANAIAGSGGGYGKDDDPELVAAAAPFGLKTMESVLESTPEHRGLLTALTSGFVQYAFAFIDLDSARVMEDDLEAGLRMKKRARKLYLRALGYGFRGLEVEYEGFEARLRADPAKALAEVDDKEEDVPLLYWTAAAWGLAISASKNEPDLIADLPLVVAMANRAMALDEGYNRGALHELFITLESAVPGGDLGKAKKHFDRAIELSDGAKAGPYVSYAESVSVKNQDSREFHRLLKKAMDVDLEESPEDRLANTLVKRKAAWLESVSEDLFLDDVRDGDEATTTSTVSGS